MKGGLWRYGFAWLVGTIALAGAATAQEAKPGAPLPPWRNGELDIHHINTGRGNAAFLIFPDGTTLLIDAGDLDGERFAKRSPALKLAPRRPSADVTPGRAIADYIRAAAPHGMEPKLDYALITHFHDDHFGGWRPGLARSSHGAYALTGITEVAEHIPVARIIDGGALAPGASGVVDVAQREGLRNYHAFLQAQAARGQSREDLAVGSDEQIRLLRRPKDFPTFQVRNIKANERLWDGAEGTVQLFDSAVAVYPDGKRQENPLSLAIKLSYGAFDYFSGGDLTGLDGPGVPDWFDVETPVAAIVGEVDALTLDHHGNRDATNAGFLAKLRPRVVVQQSWVSDQPGGEVAQRLNSRALWSGDRDVFATNLADETRLAIGGVVDQLYRSRQGHVVIRVEPGGGAYRVFVLDDTIPSLRVRAIFGPYLSRD